MRLAFNVKCVVFVSGGGVLSLQQSGGGATEDDT